MKFFLRKQNRYLSIVDDMEYIRVGFTDIIDDAISFDFINIFFAALPIYLDSGLSMDDLLMCEIISDDGSIILDMKYEIDTIQKSIKQFKQRFE